MKVIAILEELYGAPDGNSVRRKHTKIFSPENSVQDVLEWWGGLNAPYHGQPRSKWELGKEEGTFVVLSVDSGGKNAG